MDSDAIVMSEVLRVTVIVACTVQLLLAHTLVWGYALDRMMEPDATLFARTNYLCLAVGSQWAIIFGATAFIFRRWKQGCTWIGKTNFFLLMWVVGAAYGSVYIGALIYNALDADNRGADPMSAWDLCVYSSGVTWAVIATYAVYGAFVYAGFMALESRVARAVAANLAREKVSLLESIHDIPHWGSEGQLDKLKKLVGEGEVERFRREALGIVTDKLGNKWTQEQNDAYTRIT